MSAANNEKGCTVQVFTDDMLEPVKDQALGKLVYSMRGMYVAKGSDVWPERDDVADVQVAIGEMYCHGGWYPTRTSKIIRVDHENGLVETLNSVYRSIDGRIG